MADIKSKGNYAQYEIHSIDYFEQDALMRVDGRDLYFQFGKEPSHLAAIEYWQTYPDEFDVRTIIDGCCAHLTVIGLPRR